MLQKAGGSKAESRRFKVIREKPGETEGTKMQASRIWWRW